MPLLGAIPRIRRLRGRPGHQPGQLFADRGTTAATSAGACSGSAASHPRSPDTASPTAPTWARPGGSWSGGPSLGSTSPKVCGSVTRREPISTSACCIVCLRRLRRQTPVTAVDHFGCTVFTDRTVAVRSGTEAGGAQATGAGPAGPVPGPGSCSSCNPVRIPVSGAGLQVRDDLLAESGRVERGRCLGPAVPSVAEEAAGPRAAFGAAWAQGWGYGP
jgi:hypothetical protein